MANQSPVSSLHTYEPVSKMEDESNHSYEGSEQLPSHRMCSCTRDHYRRRCYFCLCTTLLLIFVGIQVHRLNRSSDVYLLDSIELDKPTETIDGYQNWDPPSWMEKNSAIEWPETDKEICFVHVGKTAGSTLACYFGFLYPDCEGSEDTIEAIPIAPGLLPAATTHMIHTHYNDCAEQDFDFYLFVLRDPLKRIQSWFNYELPDTEVWSGVRLFKQQLLFSECDFFTLNALGEIGLAPRNTSNATELCQNRAYNAISGTVGYSTHNFYNFAYYLRDVKKHTDLPLKIVVVRTEHLAADWKSIEEEVLNGPKELNVTFSRKSNASFKRPEVIALSPTAQRRICAALCKEIQIYKGLLRSAINLNKEDIEQSMAELEASCPVEAVKTVCGPRL
jgi:hypothetical protein